MTRSPKNRFPLRTSWMRERLIRAGLASGLMALAGVLVPLASQTEFAAADDTPVGRRADVAPAPEEGELTEAELSDAAPTPGESDSESVKKVVAPAEVPPPHGVERQIPGQDSEATSFPPFVYESMYDVREGDKTFLATPDRWRLLYAGKWYDPYNQNVLKGDIPITGTGNNMWFVELGLISDTLFEYQRIPLPVGGISTESPNSNNTFGNGRRQLYVQNIIPSLSIIHGNTTFKPPDLEIRVIPVFNLNYIDGEEQVVRIDPTAGENRDDAHIGFSELFIDKHLVDISDRYDFISARVGIQKFNADFRGFLFNDEAPGVRIFGNWDNNKLQYNIGYFRRLNKDTNSAQNTFEDRYEDVYVANVFKQDALVLGHQLQGVVLHRRDNAGDEGNYFDENGFLVRPAAIGDERPKNIRSTYLGLNSDGHIGRINTSTHFYYVFGEETHSQIAQRQVDISAGMAAVELSYDMDWIRFRGSVLWASGDGDTRDGQANGFDAVFDVPNFGGGDNTFLQRQGFPFVGGGGVNLFQRLSLFPNLRAGKEEGQSNFVNPGIRMLNLGADFEVLPELRVITNANYIQFDDTDVLETLRQDGSFDRDFGLDLSAGVLYRPFMHQNVQIRAGVGTLFPGDGAKELFGDKQLWSAFANVILVY